MSSRALCPACGGIKHVNGNGLMSRHYVAFDISKRAIHTLGQGRVKRLCSGSGKPPRVPTHTPPPPRPGGPA
jgi:hypothetical protein